MDTTECIPSSSRKKNPNLNWDRIAFDGNKMCIVKKMGGDILTSASNNLAIAREMYSNFWSCGF